MAERNFNVSVLLGVVDKASGQLGKFNNTIQKNKEAIQTTGLAMTAFGGAVVGALGLAIKAAGEQERVFKKLEHAVTLQGDSWEAAKPSIDKFLTSMQATTVYGDTQMAKVLQDLSIYTDNMDDAMRGAKLATDLAASGMFDLNTASRYVGMAMAGNVEMLGRYIPELRSGADATLKNMSASEKAEHALKLLQERFGGMAEAELVTFPALVQQLNNYFGDFVEAIGDQLLPVLKDFVSKATEVMKNIIGWIQNNKMLTAEIVKVVAVLGTFSLPLGGLLLALPTLASSINILIPLLGKLATVMAAHPIIAIAAALTLATTAVMKYVEAKQSDYLATIKTGKTHQEMIKILQKEREETIKQLKSKRLSAEKRTQLERRLLMTVKAIKRQEVLAEKKASEKILADKKTAADKATQILVAENQKALAKQQKYQEALFQFELQMGRKSLEDKRLRIETALSNVEAGTLREIELKRELYDVVRQIEEEQALSTQYTIGGGFQRMLEGMREAQLNWADAFVSLSQSVQSSIAGGFEHFFVNIGEGWDALADGMQKIGEGVKVAVIKMISEMAAQWVVKHGVMTAASLAWAAAEKAILMAVWLWEQAVAAVRVIAGFATIPIVGWLIGLGAAAAMISIMNSKFKFFEKGVENFGGGWAMTGERGPELVKLPAGASVYSNRKTEAMLAGAGGGVILNINVTGNQILNDRSARGLADVIGDVILGRIKGERII